MDNEALDRETHDKEKKENENTEVADDKASIKGKEASTLSMPMDDNQPSDKPYSGMGKEELLRFSDTPFWNRLRLIFLILFWLFWVSLLVSVVVLTITAPRCKVAPTREWWQKTTIYQIYVRSFYDTNSDGVGDLNGVTEKLDYIQSLNVEALLLSSFYDSSNTGSDHGYEIVNHTGIHADYGNFAAFDNLIQKAHERGIKVIIDFIPNHTGTGHQWFIDWQANANGRDNFYTTMDCGNLNNWISVYGGTAWEDLGGGKCYLHQLRLEQPELNLRSQQVREELESILHFWLGRGVDGFRVIGAKFLVEDYDMRDDTQISGCGNVDAYDCYEHDHTATQSENIDLISSWREIVNSYSTAENIRILLSDAKETVNNTIKYYDMGEIDGANLPLNYQILQGLDDTCDGECMYNLVKEWVDNVPGYATMDWMTGHQDEYRIPMNGYALNILRMTLPGSSIVYYGEEIGMTNAESNEWVGGCNDPGFINGTTPCRDEARTPMQWNGDAGAGFSNGSSWLPINDDYTSINIQAQDGDDGSVLTMFRTLADLRNSSTALHYGDIHFSVHNTNIFSFVREYDGTDRYLVSINFGSQASTDDYTDSLVPGSAEAVVSNGAFATGDEVNLRELTLNPGEAILATWPYSRP